MPLERNWRVRVQDILDSIEHIDSHVRGMDYDAFRQDWKTLDAVVFRVTVMGEAVNHIPESIRLAHSEIPWNDVRAMRNVMVHVYFGIKPDIVWKTIKNDLPPLAAMVKQLLANEK